MSDIADKVNYFAIRSFRDTADRDYINARLAFRAELLPQFRWSALHALEKYAKCLLILQRVPKSSYGKIQHEVIKSINLLPQKDELELSSDVTSFLSDLEVYGARYRYFEVSWWCKGVKELLLLDRAVHEIRRFCRYDLYSYNSSNELNSMDSTLLSSENASQIEDGYLEKIFAGQASYCRSGLVWNNLFFFEGEQKEIYFSERKYGSNSPLCLYPEIIDEVSKYCFVPKEIVNQCKVG
ncbi:hypothetical protein V9789_004352 [Vibrio vulnificus]|uniref:hypothetical protein n=1 Tax=Vibrio vulnificus TaxID=672 RepID=UPI000C7BD2C0|nr:hypothetical protein [Vibrio vulnificus]ELI5447146.1 hypothetical protein [Vibrio parahaemolyticus]AUL95696.1 hypothetical protein FORC54_1551 [Vibrio vulnificus]EGQ7854905.1 hypothetical protein [Vibrio vulnificus]EGQ8079978.1 hypothetical protein [Vibrio vulnificus]EHD0103830.1 hypothetical protein [Vibrio vulnificus]